MLSLENADSVYVVAAPNCGSSAICDLHKRVQDVEPFSTVNTREPLISGLTSKSSDLYRSVTERIQSSTCSISRTTRNSKPI